MERRPVADFQTSSVHLRHASYEERFIRDDRNRLHGSTTSGVSDSTEVARDAEGRLLGKANRKIGNTRDSHGGLVSLNTTDASLLFLAWPQIRPLEG